MEKKLPNDVLFSPSPRINKNYSPYLKGEGNSEKYTPLAWSVNHNIPSISKELKKKRVLWKIKNSISSVSFTGFRRVGRVKCNLWIYMKYNYEEVHKS